MKKDHEMSTAEKRHLVAELGHTVDNLLDDISLLLYYSKTLQDARYEVLTHISDDTVLINSLIGYDKKLSKIESKLKLVHIKDE